MLSCEDKRAAPHALFQFITSKSEARKHTTAGQPEAGSRAAAGRVGVVMSDRSI